MILIECNQHVTVLCLKCKSSVLFEQLCHKSLHDFKYMMSRYDTCLHASKLFKVMGVKLAIKLKYFANVGSLIIKSSRKNSMVYYYFMVYLTSFPSKSVEGHCRLKIRKINYLLTKFISKSMLFYNSYFERQFFNDVNTANSKILYQIIIYVLFIIITKTCNLLNITVSTIH